MSDLSEMFKLLLTCCLHDPEWTPDDVSSEIAWVGSREAGSDSSSIVIVRLKGDKGQAIYGLLTQSEDYTGHGCQCDSMTVRETSLRKLLTHLSDYELVELIKR